MFWSEAVLEENKDFMEIYMIHHWPKDDVFKDLSMMYRALWDWRHEGATRGHQSMHEARSAECIDVSEWPLRASDLTMHDTSCLNPIMTWIIWFWFIMKPKFTSEVPKREVTNHALWKIYAWFCRSRAQQRLCDVIMIPVSLNLHKI